MFPQLTLQIAGDGPLKRQLEAQAVKLHLSDMVSFLGFVEDTTLLYKNADIFIMPSHQEALGVAVLEAMSYALPVIASRVGGLIESIEDGQTGLLFSPGDSEGLVLAIRKLLNDPAEAYRLGQAAAKTVREAFGRDNYIRQHEVLYEKLL